jgi:hypothetical protein
MNPIENLYYLRELESDEIDKLFNRLIVCWDITSHYWYPLYDTIAEPVIAFDYDSFLNSFGFQKLRDILSRKKIIYEIRESKYKGYVIKSETFEPAYVGVGEGYWFDDGMTWIIYCSHEGSITFGGEWLINQVKANWKEWDKSIFE